MRTFTLIISILCALTSADIHNGTSDEFRFDPIHSRMETYLESDEAVVTHMEMDLFVPGNVLYVDYCTIKTTDGETIWNVAGNRESSCQGYAEGVGEAAKFSAIKGFHQINSSHVVIADTSNDCIRMLNRFTNLTSHLAGNCDSSWYNWGYIDGFGGDARFLFPYSIIADVRNSDKLLITDRGNHALRQINVDTGEVSTFFKANKSSRFSPKGMTQDSETGDLYMTSVLYTVNHLGYDDKILTTIAGNSYERYKDEVGSIPETRFYIPRGLLLMSNNTKLLVADSFNGKLKVLDFVTNSSYTPCIGNLRTCGFPFPKSLLIDGDTLYVGTNEQIRTVKNYNLIRRMQIRSQYNVQCSLLSDDSVSETNLQTLLDQRKIETVCQQYCDQPQGYGWRAKYACTHDILTITWPTTTVFTEETTRVPEDVLSWLNGRLGTREIRRHLRLTVTRLNLPKMKIKPIRSDDGRFGEVILTNICVDKTQTYNAEIDLCE